MEIQLSDKYCILTPSAKRINANEAKQIENELISYSDFRIGIDMEYVQELTVDFMERVAKYANLSMFNIDSCIFTLLTFMKLDKCLNLYVTEEDFISDSHRVLSRKFVLV